MKSRRFSTLNWITDAASVNSFIWSGGLDMKVPMKKPLGYPPTNLLTLPTLSPISILNILPNLAQFPFNKSVHFFPFYIFLSHKIFRPVLLTCSASVIFPSVISLSVIFLSLLFHLISVCSSVSVLIFLSVIHTKKK